MATIINTSTQLKGTICALFNKKSGELILRRTNLPLNGDAPDGTTNIPFRDEIELTKLEAEKLNSANHVKEWQEVVLDVKKSQDSKGGLRTTTLVYKRGILKEHWEGYPRYQSSEGVLGKVRGKKELLDRLAQYGIVWKDGGKCRVMKNITIQKDINVLEDYFSENK